MDAVLRFGRLPNELVRRAEATGWKVVPTTRGDGHNVVVSSGSSFSTQLEEVEFFLKSNVELVAEITGKYPGGELDFGNLASEARLVANHRFSAAFLGLLGELDISLNVSWYS